MGNPRIIADIFSQLCYDILSVNGVVRYSLRMTWFKVSELLRRLIQLTLESTT
jgi:hypothetical protein